MKPDPSLHELAEAASGLSCGEQTSLLLRDQSKRWRAGHGVGVERYVQLLPRLEGDTDPLLDLIYNEVLLREELGEVPRREEYLQRFPALAPQLHRQFDLHEAARSGRKPGAPEQQTTRDLAAPSATSLAAQVNLPGYRILEEIGRGGMGVVFRAEQLGLGRIVAVKMILDRHYAGADELARFRAEAEAIARLHHPNIVQVHQVGTQDDSPFLCLEFVGGGSLDRKLAGTPLPPAEAARLLQALASGMHAAHQAGIVHRDLKPGNILLSPDGTPKITDFGLAKKLDEDSGGTRTGTVLGTPSYMPPEQAEGRIREVGPLSDVYSLGAIFYECLTGRPPFRGENVRLTLRQVVEQEPVPPRRLQPTVPRDLETICLKCLQKEPHKRYESAGTLAEDLERYGTGRPILARPVSLGERGWKWARRNPTLAALIVVSVLAVVSVVAWGFLMLEQRARRAETLASSAQQAGNLLQDARTASKQMDWGTAREKLAAALAQLGEEPTLGELREQAVQLQQEIDAGRNEERVRQQAQDRLAHFRRLRADVLFHATLSTGEGLQANLAAISTAAQEALAKFGVQPGVTAPVTLDVPLTGQEREEIVEACYELLLILAWVEAYPLPGAARDGERPRRALRLLDQAAELGWPQHPAQAWHRRRAQYLERVGDATAAARSRRQAEAVAPRAALDHFLVGAEHYEQGDIPGALRHFEGALAREPDHFTARYFLSVCCLRLDRPAEAKASLTACLAQRPRSIWLYLLRGAAQTGLREFDNALADFQAAEKLEPTEDAAHVLHANRGALYFQKGELAEAVADLRKAIARKPREYQARVTLAEVYRKQKDWPNALAELDAALAAEPELPILYRLRSRLLLDRPQPDLHGALRDAERAAQLETPAGPSLRLARDHADRGLILHRLQRFREALEAFATAVNVSPGYAPVYLLRAETQLQLRDYTGAERSLQAYLARGGKPAAEVYRALGRAHTQLGQPTTAIDDLTQAIRLDPEHAPTRAARGRLYLATQSWQLALGDFEEAISRDSEAGAYYTGRGYARVKLGRYRDAVADADAALRLGPPEPRLQYDAARIFAQAVDRLDADLAGRGSRASQERSAWQDRALSLLERAVESLPAVERAGFWESDVSKDSAFGPVRTSPRFAELQRLYSRRSP